MRRGKLAYGRTSSWLGREKDLAKQVQTVKNQLRDMHTSNESTQAKLMDASQREGELHFSDQQGPQLTG
jgi:hypothetical protein